MAVTIPGNPVAGAAQSPGVPAVYLPTLLPVQQPQQQAEQMRTANRGRFQQQRAEVAARVPYDRFALGYTPSMEDYSEEDPVGRMREIQRQNEEAAAKAEQEAEDAKNAELERTFSQLPALLPQQQQAYRQSVRDAQREFELMRNQVQFGRRGARRDFRQGVREVNREQAGGSQDLATALAYLGLDTSPATMGVGLQDIERQSDIARAEVARVKAMTMGGLDAQMTQARIGRNRQLSAAEQARLAARAQRATDLERYRMELFQ
jgi:hypothetical protein